MLSALKESYSHGRDLLNSGNGRLLHRQRIVLCRQLKKLGDYNKLSVSRLRFYAKRLWIPELARITKQTIISALLKLRSTHKREIENVAIVLYKVKQMCADYVGHMAKNVRKKGDLMSRGNLGMSKLIYVMINRRSVSHNGSRAWKTLETHVILTL